MSSVSNYYRNQYELVRGSRAVLFNYCQTIRPDDLLRANNSFGRGGSIRNILVHVANTYEFWVARHALNKNIVPTKYESKKTIQDIIELFELIDRIMFEWIDLVEMNGDKQIPYELNGRKDSVPSSKLFLHVITHEFHHKGQVLSLSRHLGYVPVDTDIVR